jgi:hypothetical protein
LESKSNWLSVQIIHGSTAVVAKLSIPNKHIELTHSDQSLSTTFVNVTPIILFDQLETEMNYFGRLATGMTCWSWISVWTCKPRLFGSRVASWRRRYFITFRWFLNETRADHDSICNFAWREPWVGAESETWFDIFI